MVDGPLACGFYAGPPFLVLDELGYLPLPAEAASVLFQVVAQRYLKTLVVITTHRSVSVWGEVLGDPNVAAGMLDRLLHRSAVLRIDGDSYRLRDHHAPIKNHRNAVSSRRRPLPNSGKPSVEGIGYVVDYGLGGKAGRSGSRCASISSAKEHCARILGHHRLCVAGYGSYIPSAIRVRVTTRP